MHEVSSEYMTEGQTHFNSIPSCRERYLYAIMANYRTQMALGHIALQKVTAMQIPPTGPQQRVGNVELSIVQSSDYRGIFHIVANTSRCATDCCS